MCKGGRTRPPRRTDVPVWSTGCTGRVRSSETGVVDLPGVPGVVRRESGGYCSRPSFPTLPKKVLSDPRKRRTPSVTPQFAVLRPSRPLHAMGVSPPDTSSLVPRKTHSSTGGPGTFRPSRTRDDARTPTGSSRHLRRVETSWVRDGRTETRASGTEDGGKGP